MEDPSSIINEYFSKVVLENPKDADLQVKALNYYQGKKDDLALKCALALVEHNPDHAKTPRAIKNFQVPKKGADPEALKKVKSYKAVENLKSMEHVHEMIKTDQKKANLAISALKADLKGFGKVFVAENTHKRLKNKVKNNDLAD